MSFIGNSKGGHVVIESDLIYIPAPEATSTWKPVRHYDMVKSIKRTLDANGIEITSESYSVAAEGLNLFGMFNVNIPSQSTDSIELASSFSLGFRHSNKKQFSIQMVAGLNVFVCSNLCFSGDMIALKRKHTSGLALNSEVDMAVQRYLAHTLKLEREVNAMQGWTIDEQSAKAFLVDHIVNGDLPQSLLLPAYENFLGDTNDKPDCAPRTVWGFHNAVTRAIRDANLVPASKFSITAELGAAIRKLFSL